MAKNVLMVLFVVLLMASCTNDGTVTVTSPDENVEVVFSLNEKKPEYSVTYKGKDVVLNSAMGFILKDQNPLTCNFEITGTKINTYDNTWEQVRQQVVDKQYVLPPCSS